MMPRDAKVWASSHSPDSNVRALYSSEPVRNLEHAYNDYRSVDDAQVAHQAGVDWPHATHVRAVHLRWVPGCVPRTVRLGVRVHGVIEWLDPVVPVGLDTVVSVGRVARGVVVEMPAGAGPAACPGQLRVECLAPDFGDAAPRLGYAFGAVDVWPVLQLANDGDPRTFLDVSDAGALLFEAATDTLELTVLFVGAPPRWVHGLAAEAQTTAGPVSIDVRVEPVEGMLAGTQRVWISGAFAGATVRLPIDCVRPFVGAIRSARWLDEVPTSGAPIERSPVVVPAREDPGGAFRGARDFTFAGALAGWSAPRHAASFGVPGTDARGAVLPNGVALLSRGRRRQVLWFRAAVEGAGGWLRQREAGDLGVELRARSGGLRVIQRWSPEPSVFRWTLTLQNDSDLARDVVVSMATSARDGLWPEPEHTPPQLDGARTSTTVDEVVQTCALTVAPHAVVTVALDLPVPITGAPIAAPTWVRHRLPDDWSALVGHLQREALNFFTAGHVVPYGVFPSVYDGRVFGLEEDYLFRALAMWGAGDLAWSAFRATYLTGAHLDPGHYLHDLRFGLTPWQAWWLLRLRGVGWESVSPEHQGRLLGLGGWTRAEREKTSGETGAPTEGPRVFPGLLPAYRYGGDLDFPTQSLSANAANVCGLRALAELTGDPTWRDTSDAMRAALLHALESLAAEGPVKMQTGTHDAGDYPQLMADGIFSPLDCIAADHPLARRLDHELAADGRRFFELPRFDGWGGGHAIDAHYGLGHLRNLLHRGDRERFWTGLVGLLSHAMDPDVHTFREVSPVRRTAVEEAHVPGRRLSQGEPCVGGVGVALQLIRDAIVTELRGPEGCANAGWPDGRLLIMGGALPSWWAAGVVWVDAPTLYGPVTVRAEGGVVQVDAPPGTRLVVVGPDGTRTER